MNEEIKIVATDTTEVKSFEGTSLQSPTVKYNIRYTVINGVKQSIFVGITDNATETVANADGSGTHEEIMETNLGEIRYDPSPMPQVTTLNLRYTDSFATYMSDFARIIDQILNSVEECNNECPPDLHRQDGLAYLLLFCFVRQI